MRFHVAVTRPGLPPTTETVDAPGPARAAAAVAEAVYPGARADRVHALGEHRTHRRVRVPQPSGPDLLAHFNATPA